MQRLYALVSAGLLRVKNHNLWIIDMVLKKRPVYKLQTYGGEKLKKVSEAVTEFNSELAALADYMIKANRQLNGIGLAAVQIGVLKRVVILEVPANSIGNPPTPGEIQYLGQMPVVLVNPEITEYNNEITPYDEGCLSVPNVYARVMRPSIIKVKAQDLTGAFFEFECGGLLARCIQHEVDHLNGLVFVDRLQEDVHKSVASELEALARRGKKFNFKREVKL